MLNMSLKMLQTCSKWTRDKIVLEEGCLWNFKAQFFLGCVSLEGNQMKLGTKNSDFKIQSVVPKDGVYLCMGLMNVNILTVLLTLWE